MKKQPKESKPFPQKRKTVTFQRSTSTEDKILISLFNQKNRTGIAIYDETKDHAIVSSVVEVEANDFQNLFKFLTGYTSVKYIIPQRCNKEFIDNLKLIDNFNKTHFNDETGSVRAKEDISIDSIGNDPADSFYTVNKSDYEPQYTIDCLLNANYEHVIEQDQVCGQQENRTAAHFDKKTKMMYLKGILDMENVPMMSALGGLLSFLFQSSKLKRNFNIEKIRMKQPQKNVYLTLKTYNSLSIIKEEIHPSQIKGKGRSKEGFSVLNLFDSMISTTHGRKLLRNWFLNPTYEIDILEERLYAVNFLLSQLSSNDFDKVRKHLKKAYDTVLILTKFKNDTVTKEHWKKLEYSIENFLQIKVVLQSISEPEVTTEKDRLFPIIISKILNFEDDSLLSLQQLFITALKFRDNSDRIEINPGISEELDDLRKLYDNLDEILTYYAKKELEKLPETSDLQLSLTYMPHFGYLVSIPKGSLDESSRDFSDGDRSFLRSRSDPKDDDSSRVQRKGMRRNLTQINEDEEEEEEDEDNEKYDYDDEDEDEDDEYDGDMGYQKIVKDKKKGQATSGKTSEGVVMGEDWEFQFETKDFFYFKSDLTSQLDEAYGDIGGQIVDIEQEILREIEKQILEYSDILIHMSDIVAEFDCLFCYAQVAKQFNFVKPILTTESYFLIKDGRHLLSEITAERQFIPNDFFVYNYIDEYDQDFTTSTSHPINKNHSNKFILLSGPNFSGKSIYLKQVGIIVFLCHIGSFVPASLCKIGLVDSIFSCIHLTETVSGDECGFAEEMQDLSKIFRLATNRSLILFDEFGKNAPFNVGLASCVSLIKYLTKDHFRQNTYLTSNAIKINREDELYRKKDLYERIPTTILVTHHKEIFQEDLISEDYIIRFFTMEAIIQNGNQYYSFLKEDNPNQVKNPNHTYINMKEGLKVTQIGEEDKIIFMYRLKPGFSVNSFSIFCAKQIGFDQGLLLRINEIQNTPREEIQANQLVIKKYEDTIRDLLFRINDFLCYVSNNE